MQHETRMAIAGLRLKSTPEDVRSLPLTENITVVDGQAVSVLATGETCGAAATGNQIGVVVFQHVGKSGRTADGKSEAYVQYDTLPVMTQGRIWVKPSEVITARGEAASPPHRWLRNANASMRILFKTSPPHRWLRKQKWLDACVFISSPPHRWLRNVICYGR